MTRIALFTSLLIVFCNCSPVHAQQTVGYLPLYNFRQPVLSRLPLALLTQVNLAFVRADSAGVLAMPAWADSVVTKAHEAGIKVLGSFGGGNPPEHYSQLLSADRLNRLADNLVRFANEHRLDGIDVDLEGPFINDSYGPFIHALATGLHARHKIISAALATWSATRIADSTLRLLNFINVMSYDKTGPWTPTLPGPHAPFAMAVDDIAYWTVKRRLDKRKIILGLPFYGYRFNSSVVTSMPYSDISMIDSASLETDSLRLPDKSVVYFNSRNTIQQKTFLALQKAGGVMIWQILQDTEHNALLNTIRHTIKTFIGQQSELH